MSITTFDVGDTVKFSASFYNASPALANPTTVVGKFKDPSGNITTYTYGVDADLTRPSTGLYTFSVACDEAGTWWARLVGTGAVAAAAEMSWKVRPSEF